MSLFKFVVAVVTYHSVLFQINLTSKLLQEKHSTLGKIVNLKNMRSGMEFKRVLVYARELVEEISIEPISQSEIRRNKRKLFAYKSEDGTIADPKGK